MANEKDKAIQKIQEKIAKDQSDILGLLKKFDSDSKKGEMSAEEKKEGKAETKKQTTLLEQMYDGITQLNKSFLQSLKKTVGGGLGILVAGIAAPIIAMVAFFKQLALEFAFLKKLTGGGLRKLFLPLKNLLSGKGKIASIIKTTLKIIDSMHYGIFTKIGNFFKTFGKGKAFTAIGKTLKTIGGVISKGMKAIGKVISLIARPFKAIFGMGKSLVGMSKTALKIVGWAKTFGTVMGKILLPITIVMSAFDFITGFMEGYKEDGIMKGLEEGTSKLLQGLIGMPLDLLKDGVSWILEKFGWTQASETLDSFSFSDLIDKMVGGFFDAVDGIVGWLGEKFKFGSISEALTSMINLIWLPAVLFKDWLITPIVEWLGDKLGFDSTGFKEFDIPKMIGEFVDDMLGWFGKIFDLDISGIIKSMASKLGKPGEWLLGKIGLGPDKGDEKENKRQELRDKIAKEEKRIERSKAGENEYFGREGKGREESQEEIDKARKELDAMGETKLERKKRKAREHRARLDAGLARQRAGIRGGAGGNMIWPTEKMDRDAYMRSDEYKQITDGKGKSPKFLDRAYQGYLSGKPMISGKRKAGEKSIVDTSGSELDQIKKDEGFRKGVYEDTMGIKTIGYGFNLERAGSQEALDAANITSSLEDLKSGKMQLTEEEASRLMMGEMGHFRKVAENYVGKETWGILGQNKQGILTNMAYNMGEGTLNKFKNLRAAIVAGDWKQAQVEMKDSNWAKQVHGRADRLIARMGENDSGNRLGDAQAQHTQLASAQTGPAVMLNKGGDNTTVQNASYHTNPSARDKSRVDSGLVGTV